MLSLLRKTKRKESTRLIFTRHSFCSFYTFANMVEVKEIVVVCDPSYKDVFEGFDPFYLFLHIFFSFVKCVDSWSLSPFSTDAAENIQTKLKFALPGKERQDSVYSGLQECVVPFFSLLLS